LNDAPAFIFSEKGMIASKSCMKVLKVKKKR